MAQQKVLQHSFNKKDQAVTFSTSAVGVNNETIHIDPHLKRLITVGTQNDQLEELFQFELSSYPQVIVEARYVMSLLTNLHLQMLYGI